MKWYGDTTTSMSGHIPPRTTELAGKEAQLRLSIVRPQRNICWKEGACTQSHTHCRILQPFSDESLPYWSWHIISDFCVRLPTCLRAWHGDVFCFVKLLSAAGKSVAILRTRSCERWAFIIYIYIYMYVLISSLVEWARKGFMTCSVRVCHSP